MCVVLNWRWFNVSRFMKQGVCTQSAQGPCAPHGNSLQPNSACRGIATLTKAKIQRRLANVNQKFINPQFTHMCALICNLTPVISLSFDCMSFLREVNIAVGSSLRGRLMALKNAQSLKVWNQKKLSIYLYVPKRTPCVLFWQAVLSWYLGRWVKIYT